MKQTKAEARDRKHHKAQHGMWVNGESCRLLQEILVKKQDVQSKIKEKGVTRIVSTLPFLLPQYTSLSLSPYDQHLFISKSNGKASALPNAQLVERKPLGFLLQQLCWKRESNPQNCASKAHTYASSVIPT